MKALTLTQPWATLVALTHKRVETRSWRTNHTGRIAIHAAKGYPAYAKEMTITQRNAGRISGDITFSAIVATCFLMGCRQTEDVAHQLSPLEVSMGDYTAGRWAWFLSDIVALPVPIPCKGALSLWEIPEDVVLRIEK